MANSAPSKYNINEQIISGEAVALDIPVASFLLRGLAYFIDYLIYTIASALLLLAGSTIISELDLYLDPAARTAWLIIWAALYMVILPAAVETLSHGKSLGKLIFGMRVVCDDFSAISWRQCFIRALFGVIELKIFAPIAVCFAIFTKHERRIGDLAAGTIVIRERVRINRSVLLTPEPYLQYWASTADIAKIPTDLILFGRIFINRHHQFSGPAREQMSNILFHNLLRYVSPLPPPSDQKSIIEAILAERTRRDLLKYQRDEQMRPRWFNFI